MDTPTNRLGRCLRIFSMGTAGLVLLGSLIGVLGTLVLPSVASATTPITLYASPNGSGTCTSSSSPCTLSTAITTAGGSTYSGDAVTIDLEHTDGSPCSTGSVCTFYGDSLVNPGGDEASLTIEGTGTGSNSSAASVLTSGGVGAAFKNGANFLVTLDNATATGGNSPCGGGIENYGGNMTVVDSTISDNSVSFNGCGGTTAPDGGGIFNYFGTMTVVDSTISDNSVSGNYNGNFVSGGIFNEGTMTVVDSNVSGNYGGPGGGGIFNFNYRMTVIDSTISDNSATNGGGGIYNEDGAMTVAGSIVADQTSGSDNCYNYGVGTITDAGYNLSNGTSCGFGTQTNTSASGVSNLDLGTLASNGGATETISTPGSSAAAAFIASPATVTLGSSTVDLCTDTSYTTASGYVANLSVDQRGTARPTSGCSAGAYEQTSPQTTVIGVNPSSGPASGGTLVTITGANFTSGATVMFGRTTATSVTYNSPTSLTATSPAESAGTVSVTVTTAGGTSSAYFWFTYITPSTGDVYIPVNPRRLVDTRCSTTSRPSYCSLENLPSANATLTSLAGGASENVTVTGIDGIPSNAMAVAINVTTVDMGSSEYLTIYPQGANPAAASSLIWTASGGVVANLVTVAVKMSSGEITVTNGGGSSVDYVVDIEGYYTPAGNTSTGLYNHVTPSRLADTRCSETSPPEYITSSYCASLPSPNSNLTTLGTGQIENVTVTGVGGIPSSGVSAVVLNLIAIDPTHAGYLTVFPTGAAKAVVSTVDFNEGETVANRAIVKVGSNGQISIYNNSGNTNFAVDVSGYYTDGSSSSQTGSLFNPVNPARILDTRCSQSPQPSYCASENLPSANTTLTAIPGNGFIAVQVAGEANIPADATAVVGNLTATDGNGGGYLTTYTASTAFPTSGLSVSLPATSDVNFSTGSINANMVVSGLSSSGGLEIANGGDHKVDALFDVSGWFTPKTS